MRLGWEIGIERAGNETVQRWNETGNETGVL